MRTSLWLGARQRDTRHDTKGIKYETNKSNLIKSKSICSKDDIIKRIKNANYRPRKKICKSYIQQRTYIQNIQRIFKKKKKKEFSKLNSKKTKYQIEMCVQGLSRTIPRKTQDFALENRHLKIKEKHHSGIF